MVVQIPYFFEKNVGLGFIPPEILYTSIRIH